jgi:hypothetical protein
VVEKLERPDIAGFDGYVRNALYGHGYRTAESLRPTTDAETLEIPRLAPAALRQIRARYPYTGA